MFFGTHLNVQWLQLFILLCLQLHWLCVCVRVKIFLFHCKKCWEFYLSICVERRNERKQWEKYFSDRRNGENKLGIKRIQSCIWATVMRLSATLSMHKKPNGAMAASCAQFILLLTFVPFSISLAFKHINLYTLVLSLSFDVSYKFLACTFIALSRLHIFQSVCVRFSHIFFCKFILNLFGLHVPRFPSAQSTNEFLKLFMLFVRLTSVQKYFTLFASCVLLSRSDLFLPFCFVSSHFTHTHTHEHIWKVKMVF